MGMDRGLQTLVTGVSGAVGAELVPRLLADGHRVRGFARSAERVRAAGVELDDLVLGDATTGAGLERVVGGGHPRDQHILGLADRDGQMVQQRRVAP